MSRYKEWNKGSVYLVDTLKSQSWQMRKKSELAGFEPLAL